MTAPTPEERVNSLRLQMHSLWKLQFYACTSRYGDLIISDKYPTAATDGLNTYINPDFVDTLTVETYKELKEMSPELANMAMDYSINPKILRVNEGCQPGHPLVALPTDGEGKVSVCYDKKFIDEETGDPWSVSKIFRALWEENEEGDDSRTNPPMGESGCGGGEGGEPDGGEAADGEAADGGAAGERGTGGAKSPGQGFSQSIKERLSASGDTHDWMEFDENDPASRKKLNEVSETLKRAVRHSTQFAGNSAAALGYRVEDLTPVNESCWDVLSRFFYWNTKEDGYSTWRRLNKKSFGFMHMNAWMPATESRKLGEIFIGVDRSGSTDVNSAEFVTHTKLLIQDKKPAKVHVVYWSHEVLEVVVYDASSYHEFSLDAVPGPSGGTNAECVQEYIRDKVMQGNTFDCGIMLTDGYLFREGDWKSLDIPLLWGIVRDGKEDFNPEFGQVVQLD